MKVPALILLLAAGAAAEEAALAPGVTLVRGAMNGVLVRAGDKVLAVYGDPRPDPPRADRVLFADHRRETAWAGRRLVERGAEAVVPAAEASFFTGVREFWDRFRTGRFHDYACQTSRVLADPLAAATPVRGGERVRWGDVSVEAIDTPGYTRGSVSYLLESGGKRIACTGNLILGDGRIPDLFSLQDAIPETGERGYHGWAARAAQVMASLREIAARNPDMLVPARGPVIHDPRAAIARLEGRLKAVFRSHFEIDALRWYRGDEKARIQAARVLGPEPVAWMPMAETRALPEWVVAIDNARLVISASGAAFLVDCGSRRILDRVKRLQGEGRFTRLEGIFITHYHDDHTEFAQAAAEEFQSPVYAAEELRDILERPGSFRMPALTANPVRSVTATRDGEKRRWREFDLTWRFLPGQTLYHGAMLAKKDGGESVFFIGDSFTPTGIDDYCLANRNFLPPQPGYAAALRAVAEAGPETLLVNQHVAPAFLFTAEQVRRMAANFEARTRLVADLVFWDDPNFGMDEQWARFAPYAVESEAGSPVELQVAIRNHAASARRYTVTPRAPAGWKASGAAAVTVPARGERFVNVRVTPPAGQRGLRVVTADVAWGGGELREWAEALVELR